MGNKGNEDSYGMPFKNGAASPIRWRGVLFQEIGDEEIMDSDDLFGT
jgi:hypothetical protein